MYRKPLVLRTVALAFIFLLFSFSAQGQRGAIVRPQNLSQITDQAAKVIRGRVAAVRVEPHPQFKNLQSVVVTIAVSTTLKGSPSDTFTFRQFLWDPRDVREAAGYRPGQDVVLFMNPPSEIGFSSPVGIEQGRFLVEKDETGTLVAVNLHSNLTLMKGVSQLSVTAKLSARARQSLASSETNGGAIPLDVLEEAVRAMVAAKRSN